MEQKTNEGWEKRYSNLLTPGTRIMATTAQEAIKAFIHQELQKAREKSRKKKIKKPNMKKPKKPWPECLSKKELLEQYQVTENDLDILDNEMYELRRECDRRNIDPYK